MSQLKTLVITDKVSERVKVEGTSAVVRVTTTEASTITFQRSIDGTNFSVIPDVSLTVNNTSDEINLIDFVPGQYLKVVSSGAVTEIKVLV